MSDRVGQAPPCHQDPARERTWCAVHNEAPDWHTEVTGYRGPAGWVCNAGGMVLDERTGDAARRAYDQAIDASPSWDKSNSIATQMAHHVPSISVYSVAYDICNGKWHHVAAACRMSGDRSTPASYKDCSVVTDRDGRSWKYSEPSDTWKVVDGHLGPGSVAPHSATSYHRLVSDFGPLTDVVVSDE